MTAGTFRFDRFSLDPADRQLRRDGEPVDLSPRYLDALGLMVREAGKLVPKDRFMDEVWNGVPVTDEALTQCIRTLRRQLGDDAASPRFIETVPKHGYRFIAAVERADRPDTVLRKRNGGKVLQLGVAGTLGGGGAGFLGGLFYGFAAASQPLQPGLGAVSILLVVVCLTVMVALIGGAGVAFGIAAAGFGSDRPPQWSIVGGGLGGLVVGGIVKLLGIDAFNLLLGRTPGEITGPLEGALLGGAVGLGAWAARRGSCSLRRSMVYAGLFGGVAGIIIPSLGGRLMGGSLDLLASHFPGSRLHLDRIGHLLGESGFGPVSQAVTGGLEGALFAACVVGAMVAARRANEA